MTLRARIDREAAAVREWLASESPIVVVLGIVAVCLILFGAIGMEIKLGGMR